ncbi:carboxymuconolactone decarboxylase family protein [Variovorax paradoxus]|nr:carboxymuconolactone decarboxylase family protein [Variovorax paradoxus]MBT2305451.1 carboxymuconolactone decarboxylase family protein [Variovorax paradoxus]
MPNFGPEERGVSAAGDALGDLGQVFSTAEVGSRLRAASPTGYAAAARFWQAAYSARALSPRMKELVLVALHATVTALDSEGVRRHVRRALAAGATQQDVLDVLITIVGAANHALYFAVPVLMRELKAAGHPQAEVPPTTPEAEAIKDEFVRTRGFWNEQRDIIVRMMPEYFTALSKVSTESWNNGPLTSKERELVCIAIDCSVTHMYEPGLVIHIRNALKHGAEREEILEVFHLASLTGLEGYILGAEAMFNGAESSNTKKQK